MIFKKREKNASHCKLKGKLHAKNVSSKSSFFPKPTALKHSSALARTFPHSHAYDNHFVQNGSKLTSSKKNVLAFSFSRGKFLLEISCQICTPKQNELYFSTLARSVSTRLVLQLCDPTWVPSSRLL